MPVESHRFLLLSPLFRCISSGWSNACDAFCSHICCWGAHTSFFLSSHICFYGICLVVNKYLKKMPFDFFFFCITLLLRDLLGSISNKFCKVVIGESLNTWPKACASATKVRVPKVNLSRKRLMRRSALAFLFAATDGTLFVHEALLSCNRHIFYILDLKQHSSIRFRTRRNLQHHHHGHYQQAGLGMFGSLACARKL